MKKLLLACLLFTGWSQAQNITFKDPAFKNYLVNYGTYVGNNKIKLDINNDGEISIEEAKTLSYLYLEKDSSIVSIDGIENFINLSDFSIFYCINISKIDLSSLANVKNLSINGNLASNAVLISPSNLVTVYLNDIYSQILIDFTNSLKLNEVRIFNVNVSDLDFSKCLELQIVHIFDYNGNPNKLKSLDFTNNNKLISLSLNNIDMLTTLDISNATKLSFLTLGYSNNLSILNLTNTTKLTYLDLQGTKISTLDLSKNIELKDLGLNNEIKNLDLSNNYKLDSIATGTSLEYLNLKNGSHLRDISIATPNTHLYICIDEQNIPVIEQALNPSNYLKVQANSYCTFTPGGAFNNITSKATFNLSGNCSGGNDTFPLSTKFSISDNIGKSTSVTDYQGVVNFYKQAGTYTLIPQLENPNYFQISPSLVNFNLMDNFGHDTTINYCITPKGIHNDLEIVLSPIGPARPGFDSKYQVTYKNKGNQTLSGDFTVEYNDSVLDLVASSLTSISTGKLGKSFVDLKPFEISVSDTIVFKVNSPIEVPAVNIGDTLKFITTINPLQGDEKPEDNVAKFNQIVVGAYDPNIITCLQGNVLPSKEIGKTLHYTIDFENTGNYPAENIVVVETIDPKKYDINSIQILNTSHPMKLRIEGNKVEYYFQNIDLGEHKHGNILLKLRALSNLIEGDTINKQANIYFDYNAPVETNKETTVYKDQLLASIKGITLDESIIAFPNPNNGVFTLKAASQISSIAIYDLHGRIIQTIIVNDFTNKIDLSNQDAGIYLLKVTTSTGANVIEIKKD